MPLYNDRLPISDAMLAKVTVVNFEAKACTTPNLVQNEVIIFYTPKGRDAYETHELYGSEPDPSLIPRL